jgi:hypothetical protein
MFTPEQVAEDGRNRVSRTAGQGGVAAAIVTIGEWVTQQAGWHGSLPTAISAAMIVVLTAASSYLANRRRINAAA